MRTRKRRHSCRLETVCGGAGGGSAGALKPEAGDGTPAATHGADGSGHHAASRGFFPIFSFVRVCVRAPPRMQPLAAMATLEHGEGGGGGGGRGEGALVVTSGGICLLGVLLLAAARSPHSLVLLQGPGPGPGGAPRAPALLAGMPWLERLAFFVHPPSPLWRSTPRAAAARLNSADDCEIVWIGARLPRAHNGVCEDGSTGSAYAHCELGSDHPDCPLPFPSSPDDVDGVDDADGFTSVSLTMHRLEVSMFFDATKSDVNRPRRIDSWDFEIDFQTVVGCIGDASNCFLRTAGHIETNHTLVRVDFQMHVPSKHEYSQSTLDLLRLELSQLSDDAFAHDAFGGRKLRHVSLVREFPNLQANARIRTLQTTSPPR